MSNRGTASVGIRIGQTQFAVPRFGERAACAATDLLVLTIPFEGHAALLKELKPHIRGGSVVIDTTVPLAASVGGRPTRTLALWQGSAAQQTAELVPDGVAVAAAFHCTRDLLRQQVAQLAPSHEPRCNFRKGNSCSF